MDEGAYDNIGKRRYRQALTFTRVGPSFVLVTFLLTGP
jgi:hypothetical protein